MIIEYYFPKSWGWKQTTEWIKTRHGLFSIIHSWLVDSYQIALDVWA